MERVCRLMDKQYEIFFDMDGVLTDLNLRIYQLTGRYPSQFPTTDQMWAELAKHPTMFADLPTHPQMCRFVKLIASGYKTSILTAKPRRGGFPTIENDKRQWVFEHLGPSIPVIVCEHAHDKTHYAQPTNTKRQILIDDMLSNCNRWEAAGGISIHHTNYIMTRNTLLEMLNC